MPAPSAAILIAVAVSDSLNDLRAWTPVTVVAAAYIISRGIAKAGGHPPIGRCGDGAGS